MKQIYKNIGNRNEMDETGRKSVFKFINEYVDFMEQLQIPVADPGFPVGGVPSHWGGCQPPMWVLFGKNICENERIGSCWGGGAHAGGTPPGSANKYGRYIYQKSKKKS